MVDIQDCIRAIDIADYWHWRSQNSQESEKTVSNLIEHISFAIRHRFASSAAQPAMHSVPKVPFIVLLAWLSTKAQRRGVDDGDMKKLLCQFASEEYRIYRFKKIVAQANSLPEAEMSAEQLIDQMVLNELLPIVEHATFSLSLIHI